MVTAREIKGRIDSVGNVKKITSTMKAVASAKLNKIQDRMERSRPYASGIEDSIRQLILRRKKIKHSYFYRDPETQQAKQSEDDVRGYLVLTGDRGLCGSYNQNVFRRVESIIEDNRDKEVESRLYIVGGRGIDYFGRRDVEISQEFEDFWDELTYSSSLPVTHRLVDDFELGDLTSVRVVYTKFETALSHTVKTYPLLPIRRDEFLPEEPQSRVDFLYEPSAQSVINHLLPRHVRTQVYQTLLESYSSEQGARMVAMDNATDNAEEIIDDLTLEYNQVRQESITRQIAEISGGAEALKE